MQAGKGTGLLERERDSVDQRVQWDVPCGDHCLSFGRGNEANESRVDGEMEKEREVGSVSFEPRVG